MLINCIAYQEGKKLKDISIEEISHYLAIPGCFVWVAVQDAKLSELEKMRDKFDFHTLALEDACHSYQRPKIEEYGDSIFAVMQLTEMNGDHLTNGEVHVFVGINYVLSVRNRSRVGFLEVRHRFEHEPHLFSKGSGFVFYALMDAVVDRYFPILDALETELENIEEQIFIKGAARSNIERLYALKSKVTTLKHAVAPLMEDAGKLQRGRVPVVCVNTTEYFRDVYDHLKQINASIDTIRDTIGMAIQVNLSMVTIEESEVNKRLAAWAGIFAVATAFAGIWGMNFEVMPELRWKYGYPAALGAIGLVCGVLYRRFKKAKWL
jgi:magnesium transporter